MKLLAGTLIVMASAYGASYTADDLQSDTITTEDFSNFSVAAGTAIPLDCAVLSSTSSCNGQGPGLVPGVAFSFGSGGGQVDGIGYLGSTTEELLAGAPAFPTLTITFTVPVNSFSVSIRAYSGYPSTADITIFGANDTTVIGTIDDISLTSSDVTEAWAGAGPVGMVELTNLDQSWSPVLSSVAFSDVVPEPVPSFLVALGLCGLAMGGRFHHVRARLGK